MYFNIFSAFFYFGICSASYYAPAPHFCPTQVNVVQRDMEMTADQLVVVEDGPYPDIDIYVSNVIETSILPATKIILTTVTRTLEPVTHTKVQIIKSQLPVTMTHVKTVKKYITNTDVNIVTVTSTNYDTELVTKFNSHTFYDETLLTSTFSTAFTTAETEVLTSSFFITESRVETTEITTMLTHTKEIILKLHRHAPEKTHTFTAVVTKTVCNRGRY